MSRKALIFAVASCFGLVVVAPAASGIGGSPAAAALSAVHDAAAILGLRSPGARGAATISTKPERRAARPTEPTERVLSGVRERPTAPSTPTVETPAEMINLMDVPVGPLAAARLIAPPTLGPVVPLTNTLPPALGEPPALVTPLTPTAPVPTPTPTPSSAVPEPKTWALVICGLGLIGREMRRKRKPGRALSHR